MSSRVEKILEGEPVKPQSRVEELLQDMVIAASTQPDLSQSNPAAPDYVKNRTHYGDYAKYEFSATIEPSEDEQIIDGGQIKYILGEGINLGWTNPSIKVVGEKKFLAGMNNVTYRGMLTETSEVDVYNITFYVTNASTSSANLTAKYTYDTLKRLDEKYIPDTIARVSDIPTVPDPVTDDHINSLIDAKLGVIENGTY